MAITNENKIKFGLKNIYYAIRNEGPEGVTYGNPIPWPGAKSISLEATGEISKFYADDVVFYQTSNSGGYEGDLEVSNIPDKMRTEVFGETLDSNGILLENTSAQSKTIALMFEIEGDKKNTRFCFYNVALGKPNVESETIEDGPEPGTEKLSLSASADEKGNIRAKTTVDVDEATYNNWFKSVYETGSLPA